MQILGHIYKKLRQHSRIRNRIIYSLSLIFVSFGILSFEMTKIKVINNTPLGLVSSLHVGKSSVYVASETGLNVITGNYARTFTGTNSSTNGQILDMLEDPNGNIWLAVVGKGLILLKSDTDTFISINLPTGVPAKNCWSLSEFNDSKIVASCDSQVVYIDMLTLKTNAFMEQHIGNALKGSLYTDLATDDCFNVWLTTQNSNIYRMNTKEKNVTSFKVMDEKTTQKNQSIYVDSKDTVWLGQSNGLKVKRKNASTFKSIEFESPNLSKSINVIFEDSSGTIWFGGDQLYVYDEGIDSVVLAKHKFPYLQNDNIEAVVDISQDNNGDLLIAANTHGIITLPKFISFIDHLKFNNNNYVSALSASLLLESEQLLFGMDQSLYSYDLNLQSSQKLHGQLGYVDRFLQLSPKEVLFSVEGKGLMKFVFNGEKIVEVSDDISGLKNLLNSNIYTILKDKNNNILFGVVGKYEKGIYKGSIDSGFSQLDGMYNIDDSLLLEDGNLIIATRANGVLESTNSIWKKWKNNSGENQMVYYCILEASDGTVWLCTNGNGLGYLDDETQTIQYIDPKFTGNSKFIRELVQDTEGFFWVMTNQGLVRYDHENQNSIRLGKEDGIVDVDFEITASINLPENKILVAGDTLNYIIDTKKANEYLNQRLYRKTNALLVDMTVSQRDSRVRQNKALEMKKAIEDQTYLPLTYDEFLFSLKFAANNFAERDIFSFEYRLLGLDNNWITSELEEFSTTYSTLPSGNYEFEVRVIDPKSVAKQPITSLKISILPPFWKTWQAYSLYLFLVLSLLFTFYKYRTYQLKKVNQKLEQSVEQRTTELAESKNKISTLLSQKQSLFANVSHEFRTPISLIIGPLELLGNSLKNPDQKKHFALIYTSAKRLNTLVDQILDLAKIEAIESNSLRTYSIESSVEALVESFKGLAVTKGQQVLLLSNTSGTLILLPDSLEKIVVNLLSNAIKYNSKGGTVAVESQIKNGKYIFSVADTGVGIPESMCAAIFDRYTRLHQSSEQTGSGLGLAVVSELVKANNGSITLESEVGRGSKFTVTLPLYSADAPDNTAMKIKTPELDFKYILDDAKPVERDSVVQEMPKKTLLIIEDNKELREFLKQSLSDSYSVTTAVDGADGVEKAINTVPDVIISDLMMPNKDGFEVASVIRDHEATCHIPFILLTAKGDPKSRLEGWKNKVDDYISKPFSIEEISIRLESLLSLREILKNSYSRAVETAIDNTETSVAPSFTNKRDQNFYSRFTQVIEKHYASSDFGRSQAADLMALSERQLNRKLSALIDYNFGDFLRKYRLEKAKKLLQEGYQITEVSYDVGFASPSYFSTCFKAEFGFTPKEFINENQS